MAKYYLAVSGQQRGPYEAHELWPQGLSPASLVWTDGMANWQEARNVPELTAALHQAPAPLPPAPAIPQYQRQYPRYLHQQPIAAPPPAYAYPQQAQYPQHGPGPTYAYPPQQVNVYHMHVPAKSVGVAFLLTFFFGPLGMFYSTVPGAIIMLCISLFAALFTAGISIPFTWIGCMIWGCAAASNYNSQVAFRR